MILNNRSQRDSLPQQVQLCPRNTVSPYCLVVQGLTLDNASVHFLETYHSNSHGTEETCILSTFVGHHKKKLSSMPVSFQCVLAPSHCTAPFFTPLVPNQPAVIMTNIIYANVISARNMRVKHRAPMEIYN